jgi:hypothetical protein
MEKCHAWQEFDSIFKKRTWELRDLPLGKKPITLNETDYWWKCWKTQSMFYNARIWIEKRCGFWGNFCTYDEVAYNLHNGSDGITKCMTNQTSRHQDYILKWLSWWGSVHDATSRFRHPRRENQICELWKTIYRLKKAFKTWYTKIYNFLQHQGLIKSYSDHNMCYVMKMASI